MNQANKKENTGVGADSGFGGSMFGGGNTQFGGGNTQFGGGGANSQFGGGAGGGGEFGSGFGGTNAVSQIFKDGALGGEDKKKRMIVMGAAIAACVACLGAVWFLFFSEETSTDPTATTDGSIPAAAPADASAAAPADAAAAEEDAAAEAEEDVAAEGEEETVAAEDQAPAAAAASGGSAPGSWEYNEEKGGPVVTVAAGAVVEVSRASDFSVPYVMGAADESGQFRIPNPPPGKIYWRQQGGSDANEISVTAPPSLGISFGAPATVATGGKLSWSASGPAGFYRVEFATDQSFSSISHVISTNGTGAAVDGVSPGSYFVRVGGLNRASGKWEYSSASSMQVN